MSRLALATLMVAATLAVGGCAIADQRTPESIGASSTTSLPITTQPDTPAPGQVTLYLVRDSRLVRAARATTPSLAATITELLAGPTNQEAAAGLTSAIPTGTKLDTADQLGATANLDFTDTLASVSGHEELLAFAQIVVTATSLPGVDRVQIAIAGQTVNAPLADGTLAQGPVTRAQYASLLPA